MPFDLHCLFCGISLNPYRDCGKMLLIIAIDKVDRSFHPILNKNLELLYASKKAGQLINDVLGASNVSCLMQLP